MDGVERHNKDVPQEIELAQQSSNLSHASDNVDKKKQAVEALERDLKSRFDHLTFWQTVKVFRKASHHVGIQHSGAKYSPRCRPSLLAP